VRRLTGGEQFVCETSYNLKVILEVTGSQCNSDRRAVAGSNERLGTT